MSKPAAAVALCAPLPLPIPEAGKATAPDFIHLVPAGEISTVDGRGPYRLTDAAKAVALFQAGDRLPLDENHSTDLAAPSGGSSPARGWIIGLEARADGLWGRIDWTGEGRRLVEDRAYRHISPAIMHTADGEVIGIARASLVNLPNLKGLTALHQQQDGPMDLTKELRKAYGLPENADAAAILAAVNAQVARIATHSAILKALGVDEKAEAQVALQGVQAVADKAGKEVLAPIVKALNLPETADAATALQSVKDLMDPAKTVPAQALVALQNQLRTVTETVTKDKATTFVDAAIAAGKVGVKPLRDHYIARHMANPAEVEKELSALPALHGQRPTPVIKEGEVSLDESDQAVIALMGVDAKAFAESRKAEEKKV